jgi:hypothetical protein
VQPNAQGTQGYDPYAYVANNPVSRTDPSGQEALPEDPGDVPRVLLRVLERTGETMARTPYAPLWEVAIALAEQIGIALVLAFFVFVVMTFVTLVLACLAERGITGGSTGDCTIVVGAAKSAWDWATGAARSAAESVAETAKSWAEDSCPKDTVPVPSDDGLYRCEKQQNEPFYIYRAGKKNPGDLRVRSPEKGDKVDDKGRLSFYERLDQIPVKKDTYIRVDTSKLTLGSWERDPPPPGHVSVFLEVPGANNSSVPEIQAAAERFPWPD